LRAQLGWTQGRLAQAIGVTESAVRSWEQATVEPGGGSLFKLGTLARSANPEVSRALLLAAQMKNFAAEFAVDRSQEVAAWINKEAPTPELMYVPLLGKVAAGAPLFNEASVEDWFPFHRTFIEKVKRSIVPANEYEPRLILLKVDKKDGSSMEPALHPGDLVLIDRGDCNPPFQRRNIYAVKGDEGLTLKRLTLQRHRLILRPDNLEYDPAVIDLDPGETASARIVGRVAWHATAFA